MGRLKEGGRYICKIIWYCYVRKETKESWGTNECIFCKIKQKHILAKAEYALGLLSWYPYLFPLKDNIEKIIHFIFIHNYNYNYNVIMQGINFNQRPTS